MRWAVQSLLHFHKLKEHSECVCGAINTPGTHANQPGVWLSDALHSKQICLRPLTTPLFCCWIKNLPLAEYHHWFIRVLPLLNIIPQAQCLVFNLLFNNFPFENQTQNYFTSKTSRCAFHGRKYRFRPCPCDGIILQERDAQHLYVEWRNREQVLTFDLNDSNNSQERASKLATETAWNESHIII